MRIACQQDILNQILLNTPTGPDALAVPRSVDGLVMVLLGGIQTLTGPVWGAALFTWLQDTVSRNVEYWRAVIGIVILALVLAFPQGLAGFLRERFARTGGER